MVIVLDNAAVYKKMVKSCRARWEARGLFVGFLPPYCPQLNIVEILWKKVKYEWLQACDYDSKETLHERVRQVLAGVGKAFTITFQPFNMPQDSLT